MLEPLARLNWEEKRSCMYRVNVDMRQHCTDNAGAECLST